jgi:hypothetical protein
MNLRPLTTPPAERELLREFERLHAEWRAASDAADAIDCTRVRPEGPEVQRLMEFRMAAQRVHLRAMQLLRDAPI